MLKYMDCFCLFFQVETLLSSFLKDVGISEEQFMTACKAGCQSPQFSSINRVSFFVDLYENIHVSSFQGLLDEHIIQAYQVSILARLFLEKEHKKSVCGKNSRTP